MNDLSSTVGLMRRELKEAHACCRALTIIPANCSRDRSGRDLAACALGTPRSNCWRGRRDANPPTWRGSILPTIAI